MSDMDPLYESMKGSAEDMSRAAAEMKTMMTADQNADVNVEGYGPKPSFSKQLKTLTAGIVNKPNAMLAYQTYADLVAVTPDTVGILARVADTGMDYYWNGSAWVEADYQFTEEIIRLSNPLYNTIVALEGIASWLTKLEGFDPDTLDAALIYDLITAVRTVSGQVAKLDGFNPDAISIEEMQLPKRTYLVGEPAGIVQLFLDTKGMPLPTSKDSDAVPGVLEVRVDGSRMKIDCLVGVQGASSAAYPKKNLSMDLYQDDTYDKSVSLQIGSVVPHDNWVFKANWIDSTHVRNALCYNLWDEIVKTRKTWPQREVETTYVGMRGLDGTITNARGYPICYSAVMFVNGDFYGLGNMAVGKKRENYNIPKNSPLKIQIGVGVNGQVNMQTLPAADIEIRAPKSPTDATLAAIDRWRTFAQLPQDQFNAAIGNVMDKVNIIDYYLLIQFVCAIDCVSHNIQMVTWDGDKWYFMPYDLDTTFGLHWQGTSIAYPSNMDVLSYYNFATDTVKFWRKILSAYDTEIKERYADLRRTGTLSISMIRDLMRSLLSRFTPDLFDAEFSKWALPSKDHTSPDQIMKWTAERLVYLDNMFDYEE